MECEKLAEKLKTGVPVSRVIHDVNETAPVDLTPHLEKMVPPNHGFNRMQLGVGKQFLKNVRRDKHIGGIRRLEDSVSVEIQLSEYSAKTGQNPVLFRKDQGKTVEEFERDDFCLIIQTQNQKAMLRQFGNRGICVDSTHKTNKYDFLLYSVVVITDVGKGFIASLVQALLRRTEQKQLLW